ncbi:MAG: class B sortase [Ruminiclostridium sp.]
MAELRKAKKAAALIAAMCITLGIASCGETEESAETESSVSTTAPQEATTTKATTTAPKVTTTTTTTLAPLPVMEDYNDWYEKNNDMVGWIQIDGTPIDFPVLQSEDNKYYLTHDFDHNEVKQGAIFADYKCTFTTRTRPANTILYGHNMRTGPSFAKITTYCPWYSDYSRTNMNINQYLTAPTITFDTVWEKGTYKVFAAMYVNTQEKHGEVFKYYKQRDIKNEGEFYNYIAKIMDRSLFYTDVDLEYGDEILTLSTCYYPLGDTVDTRFVLYARRVREGESAEVDTSKAYINPDPLYFDYWYQCYGGSWGGRNWDTSKVKGFDEYFATHEEATLAEMAAINS